NGLASIGPNLVKSIFGHGNRPSAAPSAPPAAATGAAKACFTKARTSSAVMRSLGPEPLTLLRFTPNSRANLRTEGEACGNWPGFRPGSSNAAVGEGLAADAACGAGLLAAGAAAAAGCELDCSAGAAGAAAALAPPSTITMAVPLDTLSPT